jgi:hypothetical protein
MTDRAREQRLRRAVARLGYRLQKSPCRDPRDPVYGTYSIADPRYGTIESVTDGYGLTLDEIEKWTVWHGSEREAGNVGPEVRVGGLPGGRRLRRPPARLGRTMGRQRIHRAAHFFRPRRRHWQLPRRVPLPA